MTASVAGERPLVVLAGNPNVGKTTLFNVLTGSTAKVSNYPGITVDRRTGRLALGGGRTADLQDIPGTYSVNARSAEEQIALEAIAGLRDGRCPDVVVCCVDASQVARSSYLVLQLQELGARCVVALTMIDEAKLATPDPQRLGELLGCEVVAVTARTRYGVDALVGAIDRALRSEPTARWRWTPSPELGSRLEEAKQALPPMWRAEKRWPGTRSAGSSVDGAPVRSAQVGRASIDLADDALALWAITSIEPSSGDDADELDVPAPLREAATRRAMLRALDDEAVLGRWAWLDREIPKLLSKPPDRSATERVDRILLHRVLGVAVFALAMAVMFTALFWGAEPVMGLIESLFDTIGKSLRRELPDGVLADFLVDGIIAGVGGVIVFLPQIMFLFLFLGFLEDCGYLARVAYLMDRVMRAMNLHGRAFVPMLSGFACAIPAILATRTMERRRDRILTMMVVPLMTCSARLPVYTLIIAALIPGSSLTHGLLMVGMYAFSVAMALAAAWVLSKTIRPLKAKRLPFLIELPPYRWPRLLDVVRMVWSKSRVFLKEAGTVILVCSMALWALLYFPRELPAGTPDFYAVMEAATPYGVDEIDNEREALRLRYSYGGRLGGAIEPMIEPLGFDWKIGIGIVGAFAAREVFVSTLGIVNAVGDDAEDNPEPLRERLRDEGYTPLAGLSLMIFFALACQCMSTLAVVRRETRSWRWPGFLFLYMTVLAWVTSFAVFQVGRLLGFA